MQSCRCTAVDGVVVREGKVLLIRRAKEPFKGLWALPGGYLEEKEDIWQAVKREVWEETGTEVEPLFVVGVFSSPDRDPRGVVSVAVACSFLKAAGEGSEEVEEVAWLPIEDVVEGRVKLAFDHREIVERYAKLVGAGRLGENK